MNTENSPPRSGEKMKQITEIMILLHNRFYIPSIILLHIIYVL